MSLQSDTGLVAEAADKVLPLTTIELPSEYFYQSLPLCVIDAVFSIGVNYRGVRNVVERYCQYTNAKRYRDAVEGQLPPIIEQEAIGKFCDRSEQGDPIMMAVEVYRNRQRTSSRNGILKADAVVRFARRLRSYGVEYFQDLPRVAESPRFEEDVRTIPGQGSGISLQYFWMLAGSSQLVKPDRMILRFLREVLSREVSVQEAPPLLQTASKHLSAKYPNMTPRLLDYAVWKFQRDK